MKTSKLRLEVIKKGNKKIAIRNIVLALTMLIMAIYPMSSAFADIPTNHNDQANITLSKTVEATEDGVFPDVTSFEFLIEPVSYTAGPTSSGSISYTVANLPMPGGTTGAQSVTISGFSSSASGTTQTYSTTTANITYTQTGVYTYRITERIPGTTDVLGTVSGSQVAGVDYDETVYYINVYVTNVLNDDGTPMVDASGNQVVNVSAITVWETNNTTNTDPTEPDNAGNDPITNTPGETDDGKVDIEIPDDSDGTVRNISLPYVNDYDTASLIVTKLVTGDLADVNEEFVFQITLLNPSGGTDTNSYPYEIYSMGDDRAVGGGDDTLVSSGSTITSGGTFTLMHNQYISIIGLPDGETVTTLETDSTDYETTITVQHGNPGTLTSVRTGVTTNKTTNQQTIYVGEDAVNQQDFVNNKESVTPTGVILDVMPYVLIVAVVAFGLVIILKKNKTKKDFNEKI